MDQAISFILGIVASRLQSDRFKYMSKDSKFYISLGASAFFGLLSTIIIPLIEGGDTFDVTNLLGNIGIAMTASQTYYNAYFKRNLNASK
jgi:hypothetical protein